MLRQFQTLYSLGVSRTLPTKKRFLDVLQNAITCVFGGRLMAGFFRVVVASNGLQREPLIVLSD